jgi:hypothetical protein
VCVCVWRGGGGAHKVVGQVGVEGGLGGWRQARTHGCKLALLLVVGQWVWKGGLGGWRQACTHVLEGCIVVTELAGLHESVGGWWVGECVDTGSTIRECRAISSTQ